jgi:hypothetical protein
MCRRNGVEKAQFLLKQRPDPLEAGLGLESPVQPGKSASVTTS